MDKRQISHPAWRNNAWTRHRVTVLVVFITITQVTLFSVLAVTCFKPRRVTTLVSFSFKAMMYLWHICYTLAAWGLVAPYSSHPWKHLGQDVVNHMMLTFPSEAGQSYTGKTPSLVENGVRTSSCWKWAESEFATHVGSTIFQHFWTNRTGFWKNLKFGVTKFRSTALFLRANVDPFLPHDFCWIS